jgi:predicted dehydrogenase
MKYGVIGTGYWGSNHVRVAAEIQAEGLIDEVILCDSDEGRVSELAANYDFPYTTGVQELIRMDVDAVTIATPSDTHYSISKSLLEAGVNVLVEKPLTTDSKDAREIVSLAKKKGRTIAVGHIFRYHPALIELKHRIDRGEFGHIKYVNLTRFSFRVPRATVGTLYSLAIHDVDIASYLLGKLPVTAYCNLDDVIIDGIDETATIVLEYGDATGVIEESWQVPIFNKRRDLVIVGTEKSAYIDFMKSNEIEVYESRIKSVDGEMRAREEGMKVIKVAASEPLRMEVEDFLNACKSDQIPKASGEIGLSAVELLESLEKSAESNQVVEIVD